MITKLKKNSASMGDNFKIAVANKAEAQELRIKVTDLTLTLVEKEELIKVLQENLQRTEMEKGNGKKLSLLLFEKRLKMKIKSLTDHWRGVSISPESVVYVVSGTADNSGKLEQKIWIFRILEFSHSFSGIKSWM